jgi:hypothetical protein
VAQAALTLRNSVVSRNTPLTQTVVSGISAAEFKDEKLGYAAGLLK